MNISDGKKDGESWEKAGGRADLFGDFLCFWMVFFATFHPSGMMNEGILSGFSEPEAGDDVSICFLWRWFDI